jgi:YHS domain-containing protein
MKQMKEIKKSLATTALLVFVLGAASLAQTGLPPIYKTKGNLALSGYDAVSYFKDGKPVVGRAEFTYNWMDAVWRFASAENRDAFAKEPEKFAPQYGGYCAFGTSQGHLVPGDPQAWKVVDDKLYLNYNKDVQKFWLEDVPGNIQKANDNWPKLHQ